MCGSATIDGYTFSTGFSHLFYNRHSDLLDLTRPVMYLIRRAIFQPKYEIRSPGALSLGALVDMYHTRMATQRHDKVYALLSMISDSPNLAGLSPDYKITWSTLLERLVKFVLFKEVSVKTWNGKEIALIENKGYVIGHVSSVSADNIRYERQCVNIEFNNQPQFVYHDSDYKARWILQASAKSIRQGDLVCLLQGTSKPAIIRAHEDHFSIIIIAVTLQEHTQRENGYVESPYPLPSIKSSLHDFLFVRDWEQIPGNLEGPAEYEGKIEGYTSIPECLETNTKRMVNSINVALALGDSRNYGHTEDVLQRCIKNYEELLGAENLHILALKERLGWIYYEQDDWMKAENLFLRVIQARKDLRGRDHRDTLSSMAKLGLVYIKEQGYSMEGGRMITISSQIENNIQMSEEDMIQVVESSNHKLMRLLLEEK
ncbi:hypothetical protein EAE96_001705 [Botrytis aclada]|nr:hypothetical protein EAE96_001705 [Botrytis aclada]